MNEIIKMFYQRMSLEFLSCMMIRNKSDNSSDDLHFKYRLERECNFFKRSLKSEKNNKIFLVHSRFTRWSGKRETRFKTTILCSVKIFRIPW